MRLLEPIRNQRQKRLKDVYPGVHSDRSNQQGSKEGLLFSRNEGISYGYGCIIPFHLSHIWFARPLYICYNAQGV